MISNINLQIKSNNQYNEMFLLHHVNRKHFAINVCKMWSDVLCSSWHSIMSVEGCSNFVPEACLVFIMLYILACYLTDIAERLNMHRRWYAPPRTIYIWSAIMCSAMTDYVITKNYVTRAVNFYRRQMDH